MARSWPQELRWGAGVRVERQARSQNHSLSCGTRRRGGLGGLFSLCKMGASTLCTVHWRPPVSTACPCCHTSDLACYCTGAPVPSVPFLALSGGTPPSGNFFHCYFLIELEVALKPAWLFRGREVKVVQGMQAGSTWKCRWVARAPFIFVLNT